MATRAERYKAEKERSGPKKPPSPVRKAKPAKEAKEAPAEPKKKAPARRVEGSEHTAERNVSKRASKKAVSALEDSSTGTASRKSTRTSKNRGKPSENLERKAKNATFTPEVRAAKAKAKAKKAR